MKWNPLQLGTGSDVFLPRWFYSDQSEVPFSWDIVFVRCHLFWVLLLRVGIIDKRSTLFVASCQWVPLGKLALFVSATLTNHPKRSLGNDVTAKLIRIYCFMITFKIVTGFYIVCFDVKSLFTDVSLEWTLEWTTRMNGQQRRTCN